MKETEETEPPDAPEIQIEVAKEHYGSLYKTSIKKVIIYAIPALVFTIASVFLFVKSEEGFYLNGAVFAAPDYFIVVCVAAAIVCWGVFFWLKVRDSHKQAELWRKSMESYEELVRNESQLKTPEQKSAASRRSLKKAQREIARQQKQEFSANPRPIL